MKAYDVENVHDPLSEHKEHTDAAATASVVLNNICLVLVWYTVLAVRNLRTSSASKASARTGRGSDAGTEEKNSAGSGHDLCGNSGSLTAYCQCFVPCTRYPMRCDACSDLMHVKLCGALKAEGGQEEWSERWGSCAGAGLWLGGQRGCAQIGCAAACGVATAPGFLFRIMHAA